MLGTLLRLGLPADGINSQIHGAQEGGLITKPKSLRLQLCHNEIGQLPGARITLKCRSVGRIGGRSVREEW